MNTVFILWQRQVKKYFRSRSRIVGSLAQPILYMVAFGFGFGSIYARAGGGNYIQYLAPGVIAMSLLFTSIFTGIEVIWDKQFGFLKETMVAPVSRFEIMLGRTLGGATVAVIQGSIVFGIAILLGFRPTSLLTIPLGLLFAFLIGILFTSIGTAIASRLNDMQGFQLIMNFLVLPVFFLSGALFPLSGLPPAMRFVTRLDPLTYGIDGLRGALISTSTFGMVMDFTILIALASILLLFGSYLFSKIQA